MILGAGRGTRLGKLGESIPKVLIEVDGQPLLERHLRYLERSGVRRIVVNAHHHAAQIKAFLGKHEGPAEIMCVVEKHLLGTAGGVRNAIDHLDPAPFVVLYGDVLVEEPIEPIVAFHRSAGASATLAVHEADSAEGKGVVSVDRTGRVTGFAEKRKHAKARVLVNSGLYVLESEIVAPLSPGVESDFGHDVFPAALERGLPLFAFRLSEPVIDIGTPEGLALARATASSRSTGAAPEGLTS